MKDNTRLDKFEKLVEKTPSSFLKRFEQLKRDKKWLDKSSKIAIQVLESLKQKGWTQKKLAKKLGVTPQQVNKIVKGQENLTLETISNLETALDTVLLDITEHTLINKIATNYTPVEVFSKITCVNSINEIFKEYMAVFENNEINDFDTVEQKPEMSIAYKKAS